MAKLNDKQESEKIKQIVVKFYKLIAAHKVSEKEYKETRQNLMKDISDFLFKKGINAFIVRGWDEKDKPIAYKVKRVNRNRIVYDADKVEKVIGKELVSDIIEKEYTVNDMPGLIKYLKKCGVDPNVFKDFIDVSKKVNTSNLEQAYQLGKFDRKDLKGCYDVELLSSYIDVKEVDEQEPDGNCED